MSSFSKCEKHGWAGLDGCPYCRTPQSEDLTIAYMAGVEAGKKAALAPFKKLLEQYREADWVNVFHLEICEDLEAALKEARNVKDEAS